MTWHALLARAGQVLALQLLADISAKFGLFFVLDPEGESPNGLVEVVLLADGMGTLAGRRHRPWIAPLSGSADIDGVGGMRQPATRLRWMRLGSSAWFPMFIWGKKFSGSLGCTRVFFMPWAAPDRAQR